MRDFSKRAWAMVLAIVLVFGLLPVVQISADAAAVVSYVTDPETGYIYNWGTREMVATYPSPKAEAFYTLTDTDSDPETDPVDFTYDALSSLSGSADVANVPSSALYTALQELMVSNHETITSYNDNQSLYPYTDCQGSALLSDKVSSFYSGTAIGPVWDGTIWSQEHTWPNSKGLEGSDEDDIMMLRPTLKSENSSRSNKAYGESTGFYNPNGESGGAYDLRGDVARIVLYVFVRWGNTNLFGTDGVIESQDVLLQWIEQDPVDTWELGRNDSVESITGTRNVFVDYPELAFALFAEDAPATMVTPSGEAAADGMTYTITTAVNDPDRGSAVVNGNVVTAFPANGYYVESCDVTNGTATQIENTNAFTVTATENCTATVNFAVLDEVTVSYNQNNQTISSSKHNWNEGFTLAAYTGEVPEGYVFAGWTPTQFSGAESVAVLYQPGEVFAPTADTAFHAVYAYLDENEDPTAGEWTLVTDDSQLYAGNRVVIAERSKGKVAGDISSNVMGAIDTFFLENWIPALPEGAMELTLGGHEGLWTLTNSEGALLGVTAEKKLSWTAGTSTWTISIESGIMTMKASTGAYGTLQYNAGSPRFTTYTSSQVLPQLYVYDTNAGTLHYTTQIAAACAHDNTVDVPEQAATESQAGWTAGTYCYDCGKYISGHEKITPTGVNCTLSFVVPAGVTAIPNTLCDNTGISLPEAEAPEGYTFVGWTTAPADNAVDRPEVLEAGSIYKTFTSDNTVLYALYSYEDIGIKVTWVPADSLSDLVIGEEVIIAAADYDMVMGSTQASNNRPAVAVTKNADKTIPNDSIDNTVAILTLENGTIDGTYAFNTGAGYLYAASNSSNHLKTQATLNDYGSFNITVTDGVWSLVANRGTETSPNQLQYNPSSAIFSCYKGTQKPVTLYIKTETAGESLTYYTTVIGDTCAHSVTELNGQAAPSCKEEGHTGVLTCTACSAVLSTGSAILPTGHASAAFVPAKEGSCTEGGWEAHYACAECDACYLTKDAGAKVYTLPTATGHDYTEDATTCGTCGHVRLTLELTTVSLRATSASLYYGGKFTFAEDTQVLRYGIAVSLECTQPVADGSDDTCRYTQGSYSVLIANIMEGTDTTQNAENARMPIYARAYAQLSDGTYVYSDVVQASLLQVVLTVDARQWSALSQAQKDALATMYGNFSDVMKNWNIPNLQAYVASK